MYLYKGTTTTTTIVTLYVPSNYWTICNGSCTNVSTSTSSTLLASWDFENNLNEYTNTYNGYMNSGTKYISGYINQAFVNDGTQSVFSTTYINFANRSFTIEAWIFPTINLNSSQSYGIFGQCQASSNNLCLHCIIRTNKMFFGFWGDDLLGSTVINSDVWTHVAYVYDFTSNTKLVYLNGTVDGTNISGSAYQGTSGTSYISYAVSTSVPFPGYIDQVNYLIFSNNFFFINIQIPKKFIFIDVKLFSIILVNIFYFNHLPFFSLEDICSD